MAELQSVPLCRRWLSLPIDDPIASRQRLEAYLALVDRPVSSLLARDRLSQEGPGRFTYRSNPLRILHLEVVPTVCLQARAENGCLVVWSTTCQLQGLGPWGEALGFHLEARLEPADGALEGWVDVGVGVVPRVISMPGARQVATLALAHVLDRIERRVGSGLQKDAVAWLAEKRSERDRLG